MNTVLNKTLVVVLASTTLTAVTPASQASCFVNPTICDSVTDRSPRINRDLLRPSPTPAPSRRRSGISRDEAVAIGIGDILIGTAIANSRREPARTTGGNSAHMNWCYNRYRSYDALDRNHSL